MHYLEVSVKRLQQETALKVLNELSKRFRAKGSRSKPASESYSGADVIRLINLEKMSYYPHRKQKMTAGAENVEK